MRRIICELCIKKLAPKLHPMDADEGWQMRTVQLLARKPANHAILINGEKQPQLPSIICDDCGTAIPDGAPATAVSMWRGNGLAQWEHKYGEIKI